MRVYTVFAESFIKTFADRSNQLVLKLEDDGLLILLHRKGFEAKIFWHIAY